jgi:diadenosine tetraphosphate (Ap4A) HIT family hydrolase
MNAFNGDKLNLAALGNLVPQLHLHHVVRYNSDLAWPTPIWGKHPALPYSENALSEIKSKFGATKLKDFKTSVTG